MSGPRLRELLLFLVGAVGFALGHRAWLRLFSFLGVPFEQSALVAAGLASLVALAARAAASDRGSESWAWFHLAVIFRLRDGHGALPSISIPLHGWAWDPIVLGLDAGFGQPSFVVGRLAARRPALLTLLSLVYLFLPVVMAAMLVLEKRKSIDERARAAAADSPGRGRRVRALSRLSGRGPGTALRRALPLWIAILPGPRQRLVDVSAIADPRNCMPSLHVGWALLIYWHARALGGSARAAGASGWC